jgi:lipopolysaccharide assembly outer membrane protein LptD (OstA)
VDGWRVTNIDLSNVSEVRINNFDYQVFYEDDLFLSIQSKRAMASYKHSGIVLRGHVIIKTADGSTLESNYVKWDIENQHFTVNGIYVINRNGVKTTGRNISVDAQLNNVKGQNAKVKRKEAEKCFAKL